MPDNIPPTNKATRWKNKWKRKRKRQVTLQNNNATDTRQHVGELAVSGADFTQNFSATIKTGFHPRVASYRAFEGSSFRSTAGVTQQLHQRDEASQATHHTVTKLDNNPLSNKSTGWKKKRKKKQKNKHQATAEKNTTSTHPDNNKPLFNGANFTLGRTVVFHPHMSSDSDVSSQSTAAIRHSQGSTSSTTTLTRLSPPFSAHVRPPNRPADSKPQFSSAVAGPSSRPSSLQRPAGSFSSTQASTGVPSKYLAIDCEMVGAGPKGNISQLARCSIVSYDGDVVYDKFIKPPMPVTDYRTRWSGIRARDLNGATPYAEARKEILKLLKGKVLIGHAIHNDLKVLNYCLAKDFTRDTSRIPLLNVKAGFNEREVVSLKRLTKALFNRDIQTGRTGHSSVEDAKATMDLYKLIEVDWERTLASTAKKNSEGK